MILFIPVPDFTLSALFLLLLTSIWAVSEASAVLYNPAVERNAPKSNILQPQDSTYTSSSRKIIARNEMPQFDSWTDYLNRYSNTIEDHDLLLSRLAEAYKCVQDKVGASLLYLLFPQADS